MRSEQSSSVPAMQEDPYAGHTPVMRQYLQMQAEHPGTLLLYRIGDFYEVFFENAENVNRVLGLTLTRRGTFNGKPIPMAGVPAATLDQYLVRLIRHGFSVAICEQIGDPKAARNGAMERKIVRIVTPGTLSDASLLSEKTDSVLLALTPPKVSSGDFGFVWLTLTNGDFRAKRVAPSMLASELARIAPSEILVAQKDRQSVEKILQSQSSGVSMRELSDWYFDADHGEKLLKRHFNIPGLDVWGISHETEILASANAVLSYTADTQCEQFPHIEPLQLEAQSLYIGIDGASRRNLEISETLRGDAGPTLFSVLDACATSMGSRRLKHRLHHPLSDRELAGERLNAVEQFHERYLQGEEPLGDELRSLCDIERIAGRIALRSIRPKEAAALRDALPHLKDIAQRLESFDCAFIASHCQTLQGIDTRYAERLTQLILDEPATYLRDGDVIRSQASEELAQLRALRDNAGEYLTQLEIRERERTGISTLRVQFNRVSGFFIEVSKAQSVNVPSDYIRRQTLKNNERYTTPELKEYEEKALSAKERASQIERSIWENLIDEMNDWVEPLLRAARAIASIDVISTLARHAVEHRWVKPQLVARPGIRLMGARHPVVEGSIENYIPNDCVMHPGRRLLMITGPNMGGKSTYMRSIALIVLLAYAGSFVPAQSAEIGPIDKILTRIGASDDLARGRSTFMVEMTEAAAILNQATDSSLVLMDEIGRGTSTFDGLSLAQAIGEELASITRSWTLFATHYFELTQMASSTPEVANIHVRAQESGDTIIFMHDVREGPASQSYGISVASLAGVPQTVIRRARQTLRRLESQAVRSGPQMDLFGTPLEEVAVQSATAEPSAQDLACREFTRSLAELDADSLSPREALNLIYQLKEKASDLS